MIHPEEERKSLSSLDLDDVNEDSFSADNDRPIINVPKEKKINQNYEQMSSKKLLDVRVKEKI
jgi:hypothetical protein